MLILPVLVTTSFTLGIAGVRGGLGRELASQAIEKNWRVVGFVRDDKSLPVYEPFRRGWLADETKNLSEISSPPP
jgi:nucleoside-diphosphate-sugar epimerase